MTWLRRHRWTILALLAGLVLRLYFLLKQEHIYGDSLVYGDLAANMLQHHVYGMTLGAKIHPTLIRLPGYPLFLAACFVVFGVGHYMGALSVQLVLDLATCWLIADLARRLMGERAGLYALWLGVLCPFTANYVAAPLTETCSLFCAALVFYALERWATRTGVWTRWIWPLTFALAFGVLLRPDRALLSVAIVPAMVWLALRVPGPLRKNGMTQIGIVCLGVLLPLMIWGVRNWRVFHVVQPLAPKDASDPGEFVSNGFARWYRTWAVEYKSTYDVYWNYDGSPLAVADLPARAFDSEAQRAETIALFARYNKIGTANPVFDRDFAALAAERVAAHPLRYYVELPVLRMVNMWLRPRTEMLPLPMDWWRVSEHPLASIGAAALGLLNVAYLGLAALGLWRWRQQGWSNLRPLGYAVVAFVVMRSALLLTVDNSEPRYTIDCYPVVILLAAFAFAQRQCLKDRRSSYVDRA
jgi:hypothetical protein